MGAILQVLVLVAVLASFALAFFSFKTWRIYNVILVVFIFFGTLVFAYLAARALKTQEVWRTLAMQYETEINKLESPPLKGIVSENEQLRTEIAETTHQLHKIAVLRGGVWWDVSPQKVGDDGTLSVSVASPDPHGIAAKHVLYLFEQGRIQDGRRYLGEFSVSTAGDKTVELAPNLTMSERELQRLKASKGPWTLYAMLPIDIEDAFAGMDDKDLQAMLPKESLPEYLKKDRELRDYEFIFHDNKKQTALVNDTIAKLNNDVARTTEAEAKTQEEVVYRTKEKADLTTDLAKFKFELQTVSTYLKALEKQSQEALAARTAAAQSNQKLAAQLTALQLKLADEINRRTGATASASPAAK
jgi:hypothetical protein